MIDPAAASARARAGVGPDDVFLICYVSEAQISADGRRIAFVRTRPDQASDAYSSVVCLMDHKGGSAVEVAAGWMPRLAPRDDLVAMARGSDVVLVGSEGSAVHAMPGPVRELQWQPQGKTLAVVAELSDATRDLPGHQGLHHTTRLRFAIDGEGYSQARRPQVLLLDVRSGSTTQLTNEPYGVLDVAWSPAGDRIAYTRAVGDPDIHWTREVCVQTIGGREPVVWGSGIAIQNLEWCPAGDVVAFRAGRHEYQPSMNLDLWTLTAGKPALLLTASLDRFVGNDRTLCDSYWGFGRVLQGARWDPDGTSLVFIAADRGRNRLFRVAASGGAAEPISMPDDAVAFDFDVARTSGEIVATVVTKDCPSEIWLLPDHGPLTTLNRAYVSHRRVVQPTRVEWQPAGGPPMEGWLYQPEPAANGSPAPLLLFVHGGPYRQHCSGFSHEVQALVAHGLAVFCPNPRGSQGYGEAMAAAIDNDWGHHDFDDLMAGVDTVLAMGHGDPERLVLLGGSYGGYMVNWVVAHSTRFRAAVSDRSISDLVTYLGTADGALTFGRPLFGSPWDSTNLENLRRQSPINYAQDARTPTLLMHGIEDRVCPVEQSHLFYLVLRESGCEAEMLLFPGESHDLPRSGRPSHRIQRLNWIMEWFDRHMPRQATAEEARR